MKYPLVCDLDASTIPVAVTCRVLKIARQPYYQRLANPITEAEWEEAHRLNALIDAHRDDPEFGHRYLADEAEEAGYPMAHRTAWRLCRSQGVFSVISRRKKGKGTRPGPPVHDDLVQRQFSSVKLLNEVWLTDITEHHTGEGKLYLCAIKDACSWWIIGYSIDTRMKASLAVCALNNAIATAAGRVLRWPDASSTATADLNFEQRNSSARWSTTAWSDPWAESARPGITRPWSPSTRCCRTTSSMPSPGPPEKSCD